MADIRLTLLFHQKMYVALSQEMPNLLSPFPKFSKEAYPKKRKEKNRHKNTFNCLE